MSLFIQEKAQISLFNKNLNFTVYFLSKLNHESEFNKLYHEGQQENHQKHNFIL